eukprot:2324070-Rhodomonas_salina.3
MASPDAVRTRESRRHRRLYSARSRCLQDRSSEVRHGRLRTPSHPPQRRERAHSPPPLASSLTPALGGPTFPIARRPTTRAHAHELAWSTRQWCRLKQKRSGAGKSRFERSVAPGGRQDLDDAELGMAGGEHGLVDGCSFQVLLIDDWQLVRRKPLPGQHLPATPSRIRQHSNSQA